MLDEFFYSIKISLQIRKYSFSKITCNFKDLVFTNKFCDGNYHSSVFESH